MNQFQKETSVRGVETESEFGLGRGTEVCGLEESTGGIPICSQKDLDHGECHGQTSDSGTNASVQKGLLQEGQPEETRPGSLEAEGMATHH